MDADLRGMSYDDAEELGIVKEWAAARHDGQAAARARARWNRAGQADDQGGIPRA